MMKFEMMYQYNESVVIRIFGVGSVVCDFINNLIESDEVDGVDFVAVGIDPKGFKNIQAPRLQLNPDPEGSWDNRQADDPYCDIDRIEEMIECVDMAIIVVSSTDESGAMIAPVIADIAKTTGLLTVVMTEKSDAVEDSSDFQHSKRCLDRLDQHSDAVIVIPPEQYVSIDNTSDQSVYWPQRLQVMMAHALRTCTDLCTQPGLIRIDFADVRTILSHSGWAVVGSGLGVGGNRAAQAAEQAINRLPLKHLELRRSLRLLVLIRGDENLSMSEFSEVGDIIREEVANDEADVVLGTAIDPALDESTLLVTIIVADFRQSLAEYI